MAVKPSGPGALSPSHPKTAFLISSSSKGWTNQIAIELKIGYQFIPENPLKYPLLDEYNLLKKDTTSSIISSSDSTKDP